MGYKIKRILVGTNQVRPPRGPRTFTISWTEQSNMSSGWTYSDDAAGLTAGSTAFDEFFGYYGCRLNSSGVETATITQEDSGGAGKLDITQLGTLTSGDNVMIAFPVRGIKMTKSGSTVTLSITEELDKAGYQYYAHCTGTLSNPGAPKDKFYLGAYEGAVSSNVLKSWSGQSPRNKTTAALFCSYAQNNGSGYNIIGFYQWNFISALYMMKYGNPDSANVIGVGYIGGEDRTLTGGTNNQINATYGTSSNTQQMKLFGLEDWIGNVGEYVGGGYTNSSNTLYVQLSGYSGTASGGQSTGDTVGSTNGYNLSSIVGNNKSMFVVNGTVSNSSYNTYYCTRGAGGGGGIVCRGLSYGGNTPQGLLWHLTSWNPDSGPASYGSRLLYL